MTKKTPALLERARHVGYADAAIEASDSLAECKELGAWLQEQLDSEWRESFRRDRNAGAFKNTIVKDRTLKHSQPRSK